MFYDTFKLISIDPGNNIGISIYTIKSNDLSIIDIETKTIILENRIPVYVIDKMVYKLRILDSIITELCTIYKPLAMGLEVAFLNSRFPKAVMQLSQYTAIIEAAALRYDPFIKFFKYPPKYIKKQAAGSGNADKQGMLIGLKNIKEVNRFILPDLISEHEVDAVMVGYTALMEIRAFPYCLYALL